MEVDEFRFVLSAPMDLCVDFPFGLDVMTRDGKQTFGHRTAQPPLHFRNPVLHLESEVGPPTCTDLTVDVDKHSQHQSRGVSRRRRRGNSALESIGP